MSVLRDHFYRLGSEVPDERLLAATALLKELKEADAIKEWDYALGRLIKGLLSSRQGARLGFSMVLTEVIRDLVGDKKYDLTVSSYMSKVIQTSQTTGSMKGAEVRAVLFGRLFGLQVLLNSQLLFDPSNTSNDDIHMFVKLIVDLSLIKPWLRESSIYTLCQFVSSYILQSKFDSDIIAFIFQTISESRLSFTVEGLGVYLTVPQPLRSEAAAQIKGSSAVWKHGDPLHRDNLSTLVKVLKDAEPVEDEPQEKKNDSGSKKNKKNVKQKGSWNPQLPFAWNLLVKHFCSSNEESEEQPAEEDGKKRKKRDLAKAKKKAKTQNSDVVSLKEFWTVAVDETLFSDKSSPERKFWGFEIFVLFFESLPSNDVEHLFTPNFMRCLVGQANASGKLLNKMTTKVLNTITQVSHKDLAKALPTIKSIIDGEKVSYCNFDILTKSKVLDSLIGCLGYIEDVDAITLKRAVKLTEDIGDLLFAKFEKCLSSQSIPEIDGEPQSKGTNDNVLKWILDKTLVLERSTKRFKFDFTDLFEHVFKFLIEKAFFKKADKNTPSSHLTGVLIDRLQSMLSDVISKTRKGHLWAYYCIKQIEKLEGRDEWKLMFELEGDLKAVKDEGLQLLYTVSELMKKASASTKELQYCFELLYSMTLLQLYSGESEAVGILEELKLCYETSFSGDENDEVNPSVILTDILLSFIAKKSSLLRKLSTIVWEHFLCAKDEGGRIKLDAECFELLFKVLRTRENEGGQSALFEGEDEFAQDDEEDENESEGDAENDEEEVGEEEEEVMDDGEGEDGDEDEADGEDADESGSESNDETTPGEGAGNGRDEVEQMTTIKLAKALGIPTPTSGEVKFDEIDSFGDEDDEVDSDSMDDEQMMAMDDELSKIFRERRALLTANSTNKKKNQQAEAKEQMYLFKMRVLDLLDAFGKVQPNSVFQISFIRPVVDLINNTHDKTVGTKAHKLLRTRISKARVDIADIQLYYTLEDDQKKLKASLFEDLKWLHEQAGRYSSNQAHMLACSQSSITIAKALLALDKNLLPEVIAVYSETITKWAVDTKNRIQANIFFDFINWLAAKRAPAAENKAA